MSIAETNSDLHQTKTVNRTRTMRVLRTVFRPKLLIAIAAVIGTVSAWPVVRASLPNLKQLPAYELTVDDIIVNEPPYWVPHNFVDDVMTHSGIPADLSILDDDLTRNLAHSFAHHPWVADVQEIRKASFPARVMVTLNYRMPIAMIEKRTGLAPVDSQGVLLPAEDFSLSECTDYLLIKGVRSSPPSIPGELWRDPLVQGAIQIALVLESEWQSLGLESIRIPLRTTDRIDLESAEFLLETKSGSLILWGHAPGVFQNKSLSSQQKIVRLKNYLADHGSFNAPAGPYEIDIRHWQQISRKQLPVARDTRRPKVDVN